ncbi:DUF1428 domain-containing protein [Thalassotalea hakodatensis]|uniref:DUF1428 domain-containing protein n=1 Tax=Thalassotalea hakodatensis TaxID=3030492 RepID=UPI0025745A8D|nr:DUF1428 domain-containing protein [Thalassotalea hakodatensis]
MTYIDGMVAAVPKMNKEKFKAHAEAFDAAFIEWGAIRVVECWEDDVPDGKQTDFRQAVKAKADEQIVFSWIEWPDKETRNAGMEKMEAAMKSDPKMNMEENPMPFDGMRLIYGGFVPMITMNQS